MKQRMPVLTMSLIGHILLVLAPSVASDALPVRGAVWTSHAVVQLWPSCDHTAARRGWRSCRQRRTSGQDSKCWRYHTWVDPCGNDRSTSRVGPRHKWSTSMNTQRLISCCRRRASLFRCTCVKNHLRATLPWPTNNSGNCRDATKRSLTRYRYWCRNMVQPTITRQGELATNHQLIYILHWECGRNIYCMM